MAGHNMKTTLQLNLSTDSVCHPVPLPRLGRSTAALTAWVLAGLALLPLLALPSAGGDVAPAPRIETKPSAKSLAIPDTDDGLPGAGPIRRYEWFRKLWLEKRTGWRQRVAQDQGALVFLGDSITQGWGDDLGGSFPGVKVANRGISGDTTRGLLIRLQDDVLALRPSGVVLLIGTNDLEEGADPDTIAGNLRLLLAELKRHDPSLPVLLCEVFPSAATKKRPADQIKRINQLYAEAVKTHPQVTLVNTWALFANEQGDARPEEFPDLLHPNQAGYAKWAAALRPALMRRGLLKEHP
mgnify:CR=1 FL=1